MARKRLAIAAGILLLAISSVVVGWLISSGSATHNLANSNPPPPAPTWVVDDQLLAKSAVNLAAKLMSADQATYRQAWVYDDNFPPMPPKGTVVTVESSSAQSYEMYGRVNATVVMPGKAAVKVVIYFERINSQWRVHHIEEVK